MTSDPISDLIYDVGMHDGEDTDFYLAKGFRVVAIEANTDLCAAAEERFADAIAAGRLVLVNKAIAAEAGTIDFWVNEGRTIWSTGDPDRVARFEKMGFPSVVRTVEATTIGDVLAEHGVPYYMKVDIEGFDHLCLSGLRGRAHVPASVSIESSGIHAAALTEQADLLEALGYTRFKIVAQHRVQRQQCPSPAREGRFVDHRFAPGSSGLFGNELPGEWMSLAELRRAYRTMVWQTRIAGPHNGVFRSVRNRYVKGVLRRMFPRGVGWYDTHAMR